MRCVLQMAVLAGLIIVFAMQIPRSALFFRPADTRPFEPHAAFVELDDNAYANMMRRIRTADWPGASRGWSEGSMSLGADVIAQEDAPPPPEELELPETFTRPRLPVETALSIQLSSLKPKSFAMPAPSPIPSAVPADEAKTRKPAQELMDLDAFESLKERK